MRINKCKNILKFLSSCLIVAFLQHKSVAFLQKCYSNFWEKYCCFFNGYKLFFVEAKLPCKEIFL